MYPEEEWADTPHHIPGSCKLYAPPYSVPYKNWILDTLYLLSTQMSARSQELLSAVVTPSLDVPPDDGSRITIPPSPTLSNASSFEHSQTERRMSAVDASQRKLERLKDDAEPIQTTHEVELAQDRDVDTAPFVFKPYELAHMVDPKNTDILTRHGGTPGLLTSLGTHSKTGLSAHTSRSNVNSSPQIPIPSIPFSAPGVSNPPRPSNTPDTPAFTATLDHRRRVYGSNVLPTRTSKSLLQLMWAALKDKVLILLSIAAVVSLALGLFQDSVDWVEGVAIMVAVAIVVIVGSLNDWQKERQFVALNNQKEERNVKVIRDGREMLIDVRVRLD